MRPPSWSRRVVPPLPHPSPRLHPSPHPRLHPPPSTLSPLTSQGGGRPLEVDGRVLKLVIAGDGPARKELGQYAADRALPVTFVGNLSQTALPPFYRAADVFVTCSTSETPTYLSILGLYLPLLPSYHLPIPGAPPRRPTASPCSRHWRNARRLQPAPRAAPPLPSALSPLPSALRPQPPSPTPQVRHPRGPAPLRRIRRALGRA